MTGTLLLPYCDFIYGGKFTYSLRSRWKWSTTFTVACIGFYSK